MSADERSISEFLDDMALKIVLVEPGDLSIIGDLLDLLEKFIGHSSLPQMPILEKMGSTIKIVLEKIIMGDLSDSPDNYERLGQCVSFMQETSRKGENVDGSIVKKFWNSISEIGYQVDHGDIIETPVKGESDASDASQVDADADTPVADQAAGQSDAGVQESLPDFLQDTELLSGFIDEAFEHLEGIEVNILDLEQNPEDLEIINNIFRPFHTIKGVSGFLNLKTINKLAHTTENLLDDVRNGKRSMDSDVIDIVLAVGDQLRDMVANIKDVLEKGSASYKEYDISEFVDRIQRIQSGEQDVGAAPVKEEEESPSEVAEEATDLEQLSDQAEVPAAKPVKAEKKPAPKPPAQKPKKAVQTGAAAPKKSDVGASIKVDVEKLDNLVNAVGELVIMQAMVRQNQKIISIADPKLNRDFSQLSRITSELQKTAMSMRMVPIRQTFQKMIRLVRDLSKKSGKEVDLIMTGEETEIDRNMVDSIYDPLVHMIRNSVDHGVQTPEEREKAGKSAKGAVNLRAYQKGGNIVIEIEDDGHGLNTEKIRKKALERGLIQQGEALTDHDLNNLIFLPGFSTADKITDVSGRGVGMDVVKKAVEKLRGKVEVLSTTGQGSQFVIRLPLTLAIIDGIIVRIGNERYIIPTIAIQESMKPPRESYNTVHGKGETLLVRNTLVPIIRLYELFGVEPTYEDPCDGIVVIVESEGKQRALLVDELLGKQEVVIKSLGGYMKDINGVAGGTILGDGRVGLILDMAGIVSSGTVSGVSGGEDS
ncbi:chemotaxis protein CheA [Thermodesulfobacteriota bacterium]